MYSQPQVYVPAAPVVTAPAQPAEKALLVFHLPEDAEIYFFEQKMALEGATRTFNSPELEAGQAYAYPIRVELQRDGKTYETSVQQQVHSGQRIELTVQFDEAAGQLSLKAGAPVSSTVAQR